MSEIKKVPLVSFPSNKTKEKEVENVAKTFRVSLDLTRTDEDTCPMFNYKEELTAAKRREKLSKNGIDKGLHKNGLDPFMDDNDDDVRRIAIEMEAKYGVSGAPKKKRKGRKDDYADIGMGYDESDSFIDNTDGYDEMIPQNVTTLHGGFYINCGALEFKTDDEASSNISSSSSSEDSSDNEDNDKKKKRKRALSDSDEDDSQKSKKDKVAPAKKPKLANGQQKIKKNFLTPDKIKPKKKRILLPPSTEIPSLNINRLSEIAEETLATNNRITVEDETDNKLNKDKDDLVYKKPMSVDNITDIINSVAKGQHNSSIVHNNLLNSSASPLVYVVNENAFEIHTIDLDGNGESAYDTAPNNMQIHIKVSSESTVEVMETNEEEVELPGNLPNDVVYIIDAIKQTAAVNIANNTSVFSSQVNNLILSFERKCKCLGKQSRSKVYAYLAAFMKCKKDALIRRAKDLVLQDDDTKLMQYLDLLRKKIEEVMPAIKENYEQMRKHIEIRKLSSEEEIKNLRMPKKTFPWTEEIKKWIRDIYSLKRKHFMNQGVVKETLDAQLEIYFKAEIQILWPDNWISINYLMKVAKNEKKTEKPTIQTNQCLNTKTQTKQQNIEYREITSNTQNLNGNSVIWTATAEVTKKTVNNDKHQAINSKNTATAISNSKNDPSLAGSKTVNVINKVATNSTDVKNIEKPVNVTIPSLSDKTLLPQVSIIQISPTTIEKSFQSKQSDQEKPQQNPSTVEYEIVHISSSSTQSQANKNKPVDRIKTISEILKMQQHKKRDLSLGSRSNSPSVANPTVCQIIDLTSETKSTEIKRRPGPKCSKIEGAGIKEAPRLKPTTITQPSSNQSTTTVQSIASTVPPSSATALIIQHQKPNPPDTAEIQKVMEDLKALQQMTYSPSTSQHKASTQQDQQQASTSSSVSNQQQQHHQPAVSVIALNKNYTSSNPSTSNTGQQKMLQKNSEVRSNSISVSLASGFGASSGETSFQEAFQRQFMASLQQQQQQQQGSSGLSSGKSKSNSYANNLDKIASSSPVLLNTANTTLNNNYEPNSSGSIKTNSYPSQQTQSAYNIMDDMLANFLTEYGYPLTGQKPKQPSQE